MNSVKAHEFIAKYPQAKSFVKPSHLEELSPLLEVHIEAITVRKDEFHELEGGKTYMPRKETLDKFAAAAGVSYNGLSETTRKEGDGCYVGRSQAMVMGPDGKMIMGDVCEYEFDVDVRLEEAKLNGKADWDHKDEYGRPGKKEYTPADLAKERVNFQKVARARSNTGARSRATLSVLGMQTGFKNLFSKNDKDDVVRTFLFSRIIVNAKNQMVMERMLDNLGPNTALLYGQPAAQAISGRVATPESPEPPMRNATPAKGESFDDIPFDDAPAVLPRAAEISASLAEWASGTGAVATLAAGILDAGVVDLKVLEPALEIIKYLGSGGVKGAKDCALAIEQKPLDPIILDDLVKKIRKASAA